jgi:uncharacterized Ntn-hydrolase superfamily protein
MNKLLTIFIFLCCGPLAAAQTTPRSSSQAQFASHEAPTTWSIVGWDSLTRDLGVAVCSNQLSVGAIVPLARANEGAIVVQGAVDPASARRAREILEGGGTAEQIAEPLVRSDSSAGVVQIGLVDGHGNAYAYTGVRCRPWSSHLTGKGFAVAGCSLQSDSVLKSMARVFGNSTGDLAERLLLALEAGGAVREKPQRMRSASLLVVRENAGYAGLDDRFVDLRIDNDTLPLIRLRETYLGVLGTSLTDSYLRSITEFNRNKNFAAADEELKRLVAGLNNELRRKPDDPDVLNSVARTLATQHIDGQRALELAKRAALLAPGRADIAETMAECHFVLGHYDDAIAIETNLVAKDPSNDAYWKQLQKFKSAKENEKH